MLECYSYGNTLDGIYLCECEVWPLLGAQGLGSNSTHEKRTQTHGHNSVPRYYALTGVEIFV